MGILFSYFFLFNDVNCEVDAIVEEVKVMAWKWVLGRMRIPVCMFFEWTWNPQWCLRRTPSRLRWMQQQGRCFFTAVPAWIAAWACCIFPFGVHFCCFLQSCFRLLVARYGVWSRQLVFCFSCWLGLFFRWLGCEAGICLRVFRQYMSASSPDSAIGIVFEGLGVPYICGTLYVYLSFYREILMLLAFSRRE